MVKTFRCPEYGFEVQIGKFATQADGAVWFQHGGTVLLTTAVSSPPSDFPGFLPLTVDYREMFSAAGKIPGGYYKREGKSSEIEVLTSRLIDRAIRPLFPADFFNQTQVLSTVYSVDKEHMPNAIALLAASLSLCISKTPFLGPVGVVEVGRIEGKWVINPTYAQSVESDVRLIIAGTAEGINMVEGSSQGVAEKDVVDVLFIAHDHIKKLVKWQEEIIKEVGVPKEASEDLYNWKHWGAEVGKFLTEDMVKKLYIPDKVERKTYLKELKEKFAQQHEQEITEKEVPIKVIDYIFEQVIKEQITEFVFKINKRIDGRSFDQVRKISTEVGLLPFVHGSALFTRGRTQALATITLGSGEDVQRVEHIMEPEEMNKTFMLHYNFPPFSIGEVRPMRGPGRREIGHGSLAATAVSAVLPDKIEFPYTIRTVVDILESDGSSSMATVCSTIMALMDGGIPIKKIVSGIAMGLIRSKDGNFKILSDISGFEDAFGLMDFKVAGTDNGITAIQMDIKYKGGLPREVFDKALEQSKGGRLLILDKMRKVLSSPRAEVSELVPKMITLKVDTDKIGAIIGSGGKTIREIIEKTKVISIDIEPDGTVKVFAGPDAQLDQALSWIKTLAGQIEIGSKYEGKIKRLVDFGIFVELVPGLDGLVHISNIPREKQRTLAADFQLGDVVNVEVLDYDPSTGRVRLRLLK